MSIARFIPSRIRDVLDPYKDLRFNVQAYGALGDGSNDDTSAIAAAISAASSVAGSEVIIPEGTYMISSGLAVPTGVTLRGLGTALQFTSGYPAGVAATTIKASAAMMEMVTQSSVTGGGIRDLVLDCNSLASVGVLADGAFSTMNPNVGIKNTATIVSTPGSCVFANNGASKDTIVRASGSFVTDGIVPGAKIAVTGTASNNGTYTVYSVTKTTNAGDTITVITTDALTNETSTATLTTGGIGIWYRVTGTTANVGNSWNKWDSLMLNLCHTGIVLDGNAAALGALSAANANSSHNAFTSVNVRYGDSRNSPGINMQQSDNNTFTDVFHQASGGSTGYSLYFGPDARCNYFYHYQPAGSGVYCETPRAANESNMILGYDQDNLQPAPVLNTGARLDYWSIGTQNSGLKVGATLTPVGSLGNGLDLSLATYSGSAIRAANNVGILGAYDHLGAGTELLRFNSSDELQVGVPLKMGNGDQIKNIGAGTAGTSTAASMLNSLDQFAAPVADVSMNSQRITNLHAPLANGNAVVYEQLFGSPSGAAGSLLFPGLIDLQVWGPTASDTWTRPSTGKFVVIIAVGAGGGGGGGVGGANSLYGGSGGGAGDAMVAYLPFAALPSTATVQVGAGGAGGAGSATTTGTAGSNGSRSTIFDVSNSTLIAPAGGGGGGGGTSAGAAGAAGAAGTATTYTGYTIASVETVGQAGGQSSITANAASSSSGSGAAGGGITSGGAVAGNGGANAVGALTFAATASTTTAGAAGATFANLFTGWRFASDTKFGGGGGGAKTSGTSGAGGAGFNGGGGGGGGSNKAGGTGGAGAAGGDGRLIVAVFA